MNTNKFLKQHPSLQMLHPERDSWGPDHKQWPLYSEIVPGLWQGGYPVGRLPRAFRGGVVNTAHFPDFGTYTVPGEVPCVNVQLFDGLKIPDPDTLYALADLVNAWRAQKNGPVLVHCQMGLNRSGLVVALALMRGPEQMKAKDAIELLREKRSRHALCNSQFVRWLLNHDEETRLPTAADYCFTCGRPLWDNDITPCPDCVMAA